MPWSSCPIVSVHDCSSRWPQLPRWSAWELSGKRNWNQKCAFCDFSLITIFLCLLVFFYAPCCLLERKADDLICLRRITRYFWEYHSTLVSLGIFPGIRIILQNKYLLFVLQIYFGFIFPAHSMFFSLADLLFAHVFLCTVWASILQVSVQLHLCYLYKYA